jgi:hypothetical protein
MLNLRSHRLAVIGVLLVGGAGVTLAVARKTGHLGEIYAASTTATWTERVENKPVGATQPEFVCESKFSKAPTYDTNGEQNGVSLTVVHTVALTSQMSRLQLRYIDAQGASVVLSDVTVGTNDVSATVSGTIPITFQKAYLTRWDDANVATDLVVQEST